MQLIVRFLAFVATLPQPTDTKTANLKRNAFRLLRKFKRLGYV